MALACVNCQQPVEQKDAKFFHGVFVCPTCFTMADRLYERSRKELTGLLVMLKEGIRIALCDGRLQFAEKRAEGDVSKKEVLEAILTLQEMKDAKHARNLAARSSDPPLAEQEPRGTDPGDRKGPD